MQILHARDTIFGFGRERPRQRRPQNHDELSRFSGCVGQHGLCNR